MEQKNKINKMEWSPHVYTINEDIFKKKPLKCICVHAENENKNEINAHSRVRV